MSISSSEVASQHKWSAAMSEHTSQGTEPGEPARSHQEADVGVRDVRRREARDLGAGLLASCRRILDDAEVERVAQAG